MTEQQGQNNKASDAALEYIKQLNILSSGIIALSATFIKDLPYFTLFGVVLLGLTWGLFLTSIITGLNTIQAIIQSRLDENEEWSEGAGEKNAIICRYTFIGGVVLFVTLALTVLIIYKGNNLISNGNKIECIKNCVNINTATQTFTPAVNEEVKDPIISTNTRAPNFQVSPTFTSTIPVINDTTALPLNSPTP